MATAPQVDLQAMMDDTAADLQSTAVTSCRDPDHLSLDDDGWNALQARGRMLDVPTGLDYTYDNKCWASLTIDQMSPSYQKSQLKAPSLKAP